MLILISYIYIEISICSPAACSWRRTASDPLHDIGAVPTLLDIAELQVVNHLLAFAASVPSPNQDLVIDHKIVHEIEEVATVDDGERTRNSKGSRS